MNGVQKTIKIIAICLGVVIIVNILYACFYGLSFISNINFKTNQKTTDFSEVYQNIKEIDIDAISSNITIESGNQFKVEASDVGETFSSKVSNHKLKIEESKNILQKRNWNGDIVITIPQNTSLDKLSIETGAGKFEIKDITVTDFDMDHGAGVLNITNSKFNKIDIDGGAGEINITSSVLNDFDMDAGVGKVQIEATITGNSKIECGVGEIDITILGNQDDYTIKTEKGIGSIKMNGVSLSNSSTYGVGKNRLEIKGGVGSINVSFAN